MFKVKKQLLQSPGDEIEHFSIAKTQGSWGKGENKRFERFVRTGL